MGPSIATVFCATALFLLPAAVARGAEQADPAIAFSTLADGLRTGELAEAHALFDGTMRAAMPEAKLVELRTALVAQIGALRSCAPPRSSREAGHTMLRATCDFERAQVDMVVAVNRGRIAGLTFQPPEAPRKPVPSDAPFIERDVTIGDGEWKLPGTLTLPKGAGPFPAIVLVHGSGPHDRDETIGPNRPFADLAEGLASRGIAVLRYEKRSKAHGMKLVALPSFTVDEETVEDAVLAARLARETDGIDASRVYVLGHSLGGMLAPRIAKRAPELAGIVILAGNARPLPVLVAEQLDYLASLETGEARERILAMKQDAARVESVTADTKGHVFGAPASYWLDLAGYEPATMARTLPQRILVMQGGRDYQVTMADYAIWREALSSHAGAELRAYPELNHLFMAGEGMATPAEYQVAGKVAAAAIDDIASFVKRETLAQAR